MAWIYLAESEESAKPWLRGSKQSPIVSKRNTLRLCCFLVSKEARSTTHQSGVTCVHCGETCFPELTSLAEDSPAKTSARADAAEAWTESEAGYFSRSCAWPKNSSHRSYSSKTSLLSVDGDLEGLGEKWPSSAMIVDGVLYPLTMWERRTPAPAGSLLPTLMAHEARLGYQNRNNGKKGSQKSLTTVLVDNAGGREAVTGSLNPPWAAWFMGYPEGAINLSVSVTAWFHSAQEKHSNGLAASTKEKP